jgi:hypothetical protein
VPQPSLFDPSPPPDRPRRRTIEERFRAFHAARPDVYALFKRFAFELRRAGRGRYGAKSIMERIRWHLATSGPDAEGFKLNNIMTSRYVRLLIREHPEFDGFFETRALKSP